MASKPEHVAVLRDSTAEDLAVAAEGHDRSGPGDLIGHRIADPGHHSERILAQVEDAALADLAVVVEALDQSLGQKPVVGFGVFRGHLDLTVGRVENTVRLGMEKEAEALVFADRDERTEVLKGRAHFGRLFDHVRLPSIPAERQPETGCVSGGTSWMVMA